MNLSKSTFFLKEKYKFSLKCYVQTFKIVFKVFLSILFCYLYYRVILIFETSLKKIASFIKILFCLVIKFCVFILYHLSLPQTNLQILRMDILLLGCCTIFSCFLIKWNSHRAKLTIRPIHPLYLIPSHTTEWTN